MRINELQSITFSKKSPIPHKKNTFTSQFKTINLNSNPIANLNKSSISFTSMKRTRFNGTDLAAVNMFKAPIEKFNSNEDFQKWCKGELKKIICRDFSGSDDSVTEERKEILEDWFDYVLYKNDNYTDAQRLIIVNGITKNLKPNEKRVPPRLDKNALEETIKEISENTAKNRSYTANFLNIYNSKVKDVVLTDLDSHYTGWYQIPSRFDDYEGFENNVRRVILLSHHNWCTKNPMYAIDYLKNGGFHVYLDAGKPQVAIRYVGDIIQEIQGEKNDTHVPLKYCKTLMEHIQGSDYVFNVGFRLDHLKEIQKCVDNLERMIAPKKFSELTPKEVFEFFGMLDKVDDDGKLILKEYKQPNSYFTFDDLGIDENELFEHVKEIKGNANFEFSKLKSTGELETIGGRAFFSNSRIEELSKLTTIKDYAYFKDSILKSLGSLEVIGGSANFQDSQIADLGKLRQIKGGAIIYKSLLSEEDFSNIECGNIITNLFQ